MISVGVTAVGGGIGQAVLDALRHSDLQVRTVGFDLSPLSPGLYWTDASYLVPPVSDESAYIEQLLEVCAIESLDVIIPGLEFELEPLARHRERFEDQGCTVVVSTLRAVQLCRDKLSLGRFCEVRDLPFVRTWSLVEAQHRINEMVFPLMVKPRLGGGSIGARLVFDANELAGIPSESDLVVQPYLPSERVATPRRPFVGLDQSDEISAQFFLDPSGEVVGDFISVNRLKDGVPMEVMPDPDSPSRREGLRLAAALAAESLRGPVNLQGRMTPAGPRFFEANARFTGITGVRAAMGYREVEAAIYAFALGQEREARRCLSFTPGLVALRHVEATIVPRERLAQPVGKIHVERAKLPRRVLVTGAAGYVGVNLVASLLELPEIAEVRAGVRTETDSERLQRLFDHHPRLRILLGDLSESLWPLEGVDIIVHCAGLRPVRGESYAAADFLSLNTGGTRRLLEAARQAGVTRLIYLSSQSVYGTSRPPLWSEAQPAQPETPYAFSKWAAELLGMTGVGLLEFIALRCARVYGQGLSLRWDELPHRFARRAAMNQPLPVRGGGRERMDLIHIRDLCAAIVRACQLPAVPAKRAVFNVGSGQPVSVMELALACQALAIEQGLPAPIIDMIGPEAEGRHFGMDIRRARAHLGWSPTIGLREGVKELLDAARRESSEKSAVGCGR